jgi:hypothetical protein
MDAKLILKKIADIVKMNFSKEETTNEVVKLGTILEVEKWEIQVDNEEFNLGDNITVTFEDSEPFPLRDGEYELKDGRIIQVDSEGKIVLITNTDGTIEAITEDAATEEAPKEDAPKEDAPKETEMAEDTPVEEEAPKEEAPKEDAPVEEEELPVRVDKLEKRLNDLEKILEELTSINEELSKEVVDLSAQNVELKEEPATEPVVLKSEGATKQKSFSHKMIDQMASIRKEKGLTY